MGRKASVMAKPFLIAEIGHNWRSEEEIRDLIDIAKEFGWDAAKIQLYDIDKIKKPGDTNYEELKAKQLDYNQMLMIKKWCDEIGIEFMASVFDAKRLGWYLDTEPKHIKLAQRSYQNQDLIKAVQYTARTYNIPIIVSCPNDHIPPEWRTYNGERHILWCMSRREILKYGVQNFPKTFGRRSYEGFSDHTIGNFWSKIALNTGARYLEKHITFDHNAPGWDQPASAVPTQMRELASLAEWLSDQEEIGRRNAE